MRVCAKKLEIQSTFSNGFYSRSKTTRMPVIIHIKLGSMRKATTGAVSNCESLYTGQHPKVISSYFRKH